MNRSVQGGQFCTPISPERGQHCRPIHNLAAELDRLGIRSKRRVLGDGRVIGDRAFSLGALAHLLKNRTYVGEVSHHGEHHPGEHEGIVERELFEAVQAQLATNRQGHRSGCRAALPSLLASMIYDGEGRPMTPRHATKGSRRYRYYVTAPTTADGRIAASAWKVPTGELDQLVRERLAEWLSSAHAVPEMAGGALKSSAVPALLESASALAKLVSTMSVADLRLLLLDLSSQVQIDRDHVLISIRAGALLGRLGLADSGSEAEHRCTLTVPAALTRRGQELRLAFAPDDRSAPAQIDNKLVGLLAKGLAAHQQLVTGTITSKIERAHLTRLARLTTLAPDITSAILDGRQPVQLTARSLLRLSELPLAWAEQRTLLGFA